MKWRLIRFNDGRLINRPVPVPATLKSPSLSTAHYDDTVKINQPVWILASIISSQWIINEEINLEIILAPRVLLIATSHHLQH